MDIQLRNNLREAYNRQADRRDANPLQDWKVAERSRFLTRLQLEAKRTLLEIGSGPGHDSRFFQDHGLAVVCIDLSPEMVKRCQAKGLTGHVMDVADLQFPACSFDAIYAVNSLLHLPPAELPPALRGIDRVLKPGGVFYLGVYGGYSHAGIWEQDSYLPPRFFSFHPDADLQQIVAEVFDLLDFKPIPVAEDRLHFQALTLRKREQPRAV